MEVEVERDRCMVGSEGMRVGEVVVGHRRARMENLLGRVGLACSEVASVGGVRRRLCLVKGSLLNNRTSRTRGVLGRHLVVVAEGVASRVASRVISCLDPGRGDRGRRVARRHRRCCPEWMALGVSHRCRVGVRVHRGGRLRISSNNSHRRMGRVPPVVGLDGMRPR